MKNITVDMIMDARPCRYYPRKRVKELFDGRKELTPDELFALGINEDDRWWVFTHCGMATSREYRLIACDIADEIVMPIWRKYHKDDTKVQKTIDIARMYANGAVTYVEFVTVKKVVCDAACNATWDVAMDAICDIAKDAAKDAAWDVARDAARSAARSAIWDAAWAADRDAAWDKSFNIAKRYQ